MSVSLLEMVGGRRAIVASFFFLLAGVLAISLSGKAVTPSSESTASESDDVLLVVDRATRAARDAVSTSIETPGDLNDALDRSQQMRNYYRQTHDPRYLGAAEAQIALWLTGNTVPLEVLVLQADIDQAAHRFDSARARLRQAATSAPEDVRIWSMLAAIELATGRIESARAACGRLITISRPLISTGCAAQVAGVTGNANAAYALLSKTLARETGESPAVRAWSHGILADLSQRLGSNNDAEKHFESALTLNPDQVSLKNDYALHLFFNGQYDAVMSLTGSTQALQLPWLMAAAARGELTGQKNAVANQRAQFEQDSLQENNGHRREQAFFALFVERDLESAVSYTLENWATQREPVDVLLLAHAGIAAGSNEALEHVRIWLRDTKLEDVRVAKLLESES